MREYCLWICSIISEVCWVFNIPALTKFYSRKLQSDLKTTKVEEMKMQLETCYKEILRLSTLKQAGALSA